MVDSGGFYAIIDTFKFSYLFSTFTDMWIGLDTKSNLLEKPLVFDLTTTVEGPQINRMENKLHAVEIQNSSNSFNSTTVT